MLLAKRYRSTGGKLCRSSGIGSSMPSSHARKLDQGQSAGSPAAPGSYGHSSVPNMATQAWPCHPARKSPHVRRNRFEFFCVTFDRLAASTITYVRTRWYTLRQEGEFSQQDAPRQNRGRARGGGPGGLRFCHRQDSWANALWAAYRPPAAPEPRGGAAPAGPPLWVPVDVPAAGRMRLILGRIEGPAAGRGGTDAAPQGVPSSPFCTNGLESGCRPNKDPQQSGCPRGGSARGSRHGPAERAQGSQYHGDRYGR